MSYRQLTIITMEPEYRNRASEQKKLTTQINICATYKRSGNQRESIIPQNEHHHKKQRELFAFIESCCCWLLFLIELCVQLIWVSICNLRQVHLLIGKLVWLKKRKMHLKIVSSDHSVQQCGFLKFAFCLLLTINVVSAANYCSMCSNHVACKNQSSVGSTE